MKLTRSTAWTIAIVGPFIIETAYLTMSRWPTRWFTPSMDCAALGGALIAGGFGFAQINTTAAHKVLRLVVYLVVATLIDLWYSLAFVCAAFRDCL